MAKIKNQIDTLQKSDLAVSQIVRLELQYMHEIGRIKHNLDAIIRALQQDFGFKEVNPDNALITNFAIDINWTHDVFDHLIVASAMADDAKLITKDKSILADFNQAVWA
jgi:PIN domain nuclease of toxin-antitoxin system